MFGVVWRYQCPNNFDLKSNSIGEASERSLKILFLQIGFAGNWFLEEWFLEHHHLGKHYVWQAVLQKLSFEIAQPRFWSLSFEIPLQKAWAGGWCVRRWEVRSGKWGKWSFLRCCPVSNFANSCSHVVQARLEQEYSGFTFVISQIMMASSSESQFPVRVWSNRSSKYLSAARAHTLGNFNGHGAPRPPMRFSFGGSSDDAVPSSFVLSSNADSMACASNNCFGKLFFLEPGPDIYQLPSQETQ